MRGRTALVTGAGRGLGREIAWAIAESGATVGVNDIDEAIALQAVDDLASAGHAAFAAPADVADPHEVARMIEDVRAAHGPVHWLINNAGLYVRQAVPFWHTPVEEWNRVMEVTLTSVFLCSKAVAPEMVDAGYGRIVNIASQAAFSFVPWQGPHYHAAKAGVVQLTRAMASDLARHGVTVNAVAPTAVLTPESKIRFAADPAAKQRVEEHIPMGRFAEPREVAAAVMFLLSDGASFVTAETLPVRGGLYSYGIHREPDA